MIVCYAWLGRISIDGEWSETARNRAPSVDEGPMLFMAFLFRNVAQYEIGRGN
jgi:hypothetical protein